MLSSPHLLSSGRLRSIILLQKQACLSTAVRICGYIMMSSFAYLKKGQMSISVRVQVLAAAA